MPVIINAAVEDPVLTISTGYDPGYLTHAVATGRENYYLSAVAEHGEPPGVWTGAGCPELGLAAGSEVDPAVMERVYGAFADPRDPGGMARLGRAPSGFGGLDEKIAGRIGALLAAEPDAAPERRDALIMRALGERRAAVFFFDLTFSVPKSVSLLHASLQVKAQQARENGQADEAGKWGQRADAVWDAVMAANQAMLEYLQREAGYSRAGYHGQGSGRFADAHEWVIASFRQHTSRDGDPQLHVHNAVLNRVLRDDPLAREGEGRAWRTLDGAGLYAARPAAGAIAERTRAAQLTARLGVDMLPRPDGNGWEIAGIPEELRDLFSSRRRAITPRVAQLIEQYELKHGKKPNARVVWSMAQFVTLDSRQPKAHAAPARAELLGQWEAQSRRAETHALSAIPGAALGRRGPVRAAPREPVAQIDNVLAAAVADALRSKATFTRYHLIRMIGRHLPLGMGGRDGRQVTALLDGLADRALAPGGPYQVVRLTAQELVRVPERFRRGDGLSLWRRHGADVYTTRGQLDVEARLLHATAQGGAPRLAPDRAAAALGADRARLEDALWREHGPPGARRDIAHAGVGAGEPLSRIGLTDDQAQAVYGILTSGRAIDILVGPAGTGKTRTVTALAGIWRQAGLGRVTGLTTSTNAARTLAAEGLGECHNLADFLGKVKDSDATRGHLPVRNGDLLIVDEASMAATADLAAVEQIAAAHGAKILLTGDTAQLTAPEAGGAMRLLASEHGCYQLRTVQRFEHAWEAAASLRLRDGDPGVLAEYDRRGRILGGTREEMTAAAVSRWLADHLAGADTLLLAATNAQAAELGRRARDQLAALGLAGTGEPVELADGNLAGPGDLLMARQNDRLIAAGPGRRLANRDVLMFEAWAGRGGARSALVRLRSGRDPVTGRVSWGPPFELPITYLREHVQLAYAGNVHVAQSRTVDTAHLVIDETAGREAMYVGMSRGRQRNTAYVITERPRAADLSPRPRPSPDVADPGASRAGRPHRLTVLATVMDREQGELTGTEVLRRELDRAAGLATLAPVWADFTGAYAARRYEDTIRSLLTKGEWQQFCGDAERGTLARLLRAAELAGHDTDFLIGQAVGKRDLAGSRSIAAVLHSRVQRITGTPEPAAVSYRARTPAIAEPNDRAFAQALAEAMDARAAELGDRAVLDGPAWARRHLGQVPGDPLARADWARRATIVAAYREERGWTSQTDAIGPAPERASPELRASWYAAYIALRMPELDRETRAATDGELLVRRAAYQREAAWAPKYVAGELRDAHLAEDACRADAVLAWHQADAARNWAGRSLARQRALELGSCAQQAGARRRALEQIAEARAAWLEATASARQRAMAADTELRRRYPDIELSALHPEAEPGASTYRQAATPEMDNAGSPLVRNDQGRLDIEAAVTVAKRAMNIVTKRQEQAREAVGAEIDDPMCRHEAEPLREVRTRLAAVRQGPLSSRRAGRQTEPDLEPEAGG